MDLDEALCELGQFGPYQGIYFTLILFPVVLSGFRYTEYIYTTLDIPHRCRIPECEGSMELVEFSPLWIDAAVPLSKTGLREPCQRYRFQNQNISFDRNLTTCHDHSFFTDEVETCTSWVFSEPARTIIHDFNIMCPEDYWKRTIISSLAIISSCVGFPITGLLSDRYGRKAVLVVGGTMVAVTGIVRSFSINYSMLATLETFDGLIIGALYEPAFLLGLESLAPSKRLLGTMIITIYFALGQVVLACLVWWAQDWRLLLRMFYTPMLAMISLHWLLSESVRWLYTNKKYDETRSVFKKIASMNHTKNKLPRIINEINDAEMQCSRADIEEEKISFPFIKAIKSPIIATRFLICSVCRVMILFVYYGLSLSSIHSDGNCYLSFLLVSMAELPGYMASYWVPGFTFLGRRGAAAGSFFFLGVTCLTMFFVEHQNEMLSLTLSLMAKFCSTLGLTVIYLYTAELFPTNARHTLISATITIGSLGFISAQQLPLVDKYINEFMVYGVASVIGMVVVFAGPETLNSKLPNTLEEAEAIGSNTGGEATDKIKLNPI